MTIATPAIERVLRRIEFDSSGCWLWTGPTRDGYGRVAADGKSASVHRVVYEASVGAIPDGLHLDHLCRIRHCVNPDHLEPVSQRENTLRGTSPSAAHAAKTHCPHGHAYDAANTITYRGRRYCRACRRRITREWWQRNRVNPN